MRGREHCHTVALSRPLSLCRCGGGASLTLLPRRLHPPPPAPLLPCPAQVLVAALRTTMAEVLNLLVLLCLLVYIFAIMGFYFFGYQQQVQ